MAYQLIMIFPPGTPRNRGNLVGQDKLAFSFASSKLRKKLEQFIAEGKTPRHFTEYEIGGYDHDQGIIIPMLFSTLEATHEWLEFVREDYSPKFEIKQVNFNFEPNQV